MRKSIIRTITATTIQSLKVVFENGQPKLIDNEVMTLNGKIDEATAIKIIRKEYGENAQLKSVEETTNIYEISVDDFIKNATVIVPKKEVAIDEVKEV